MRYSIPGLTAAMHSAIAHTSAMIQDGTIALRDLATESKRWSELNRVKLPSPSVSDYVTPAAATASSQAEELLDSLEIGWVYSEKDTPPGKLSDGGNDTTDFTQGTASRRLDSTDTGLEAQPGDYMRITKSIDLTDVNTITFDFKVDANLTHATLDTAYIEMLIGATTVFSQTNKGLSPEWQRSSVIDVSGYTGLQDISLQFRYAMAWNNYPGSVRFDNLLSVMYAANTKDDNITTRWRPSPANEPGAWCQWDMGALKICGGCRIYWGTDTAYLPTEYKIQVSEDGTTWIDVAHETTAPPAGAWKEYSWVARYARYIRMLVITHGASGTELFEADYYSRITDRVAAEHAHGSLIVPHLTGSNVRPFEELRRAPPTVETLAKRLELLENLTL